MVKWRRSLMGDIYIYIYIHTGIHGNTICSGFDGLMKHLKRNTEKQASFELGWVENAAVLNAHTQTF